MTPQISISSNYASIETAKFKAYYGHEEIDLPTEEWCGVIWKNGKEVFRRTNSQLSDADMSPEHCLLTLIGLYLSK